ncbi:MAG: response regulator [Candidatus Eisenbacteria bacterium]|nr:response regulator [Candidatus Eisenbacteria bacterium]
MKRILWIEDEADTALASYKIPLVRAGYTVDIAGDASEAIELLREKQYDVFVFDIIIPAGPRFGASDKNFVGFDLLEALVKGQIEGVRRIDPNTVIVFTVVNDPELHSRISELGVNRLFVKSLSGSSVLKSAVDDILGIASEDVGE